MTDSKSADKLSFRGYFCCFPDVPARTLLCKVPAFLILASLPAAAQLSGPDAEPARGLWRAPSDYPMPYAPMEVATIGEVLGRMVDYLEEASPVRIVDLETEARVLEGESWPELPGLESGLFSIISYEWGVTYAGMLEAWRNTGDEPYRNFIERRFAVMRKLAEHYAAMPEDERPRRYPMMRMLQPRSLDHCGAMAAAFIKVFQEGLQEGLEVVIEPALRYIREEEFRFADGTLARNRPMPGSLWLDDLYMSVPALARMGDLTGNSAYFDDAAAQVLQFAERMFVPEEGLYRHGWVSDMDVHPYFPWGRANGWAIMAKTELLSVLPEDHPNRPAIFDLYRKHIAGIAGRQGINGLWHQLLDRPETYEETSASAMFVFAIARGINRGWLDPLAYGPVASVGWNAVAGKVNDLGQVEGTCVGTGMGWDPAFYAYRNTSVYAAHGYGPVLLAGAEMIALRKGAGSRARIHDGAVHFGETPDW